MDYSQPGLSVHGILQARILEWVAIPFSRGSSQPRDWIQISCIAGRIFTTEPPGSPAKEVWLFWPPCCEEAQASHMERPCRGESRNSIDSENWGTRYRSPVKLSWPVPICFSHASWGSRYRGTQTSHPLCVGILYPQNHKQGKWWLFSAIKLEGGSVTMEKRNSRMCAVRGMV